MFAFFQKHKGVPKLLTFAFSVHWAGDGEPSEIWSTFIAWRFVVSIRACPRAVLITLCTQTRNLHLRLLSPRSVNVVNVGGDYEIGRSVCPSFSLCPSFRVCTWWLRNGGALL